MTDLHNHLRLGQHECGNCGNCKFFARDERHGNEHEMIGLCLQEELAHFDLRVSADSGCNRFKPAEQLVGTGPGFGAGADRGANM